MGITGDFFVKHVRPYGQEAYDWATDPNGPVYHYLSAIVGLDDPTIATLFAGWRAAALADINAANLPLFEAAADALAAARWQEFYPTGHSTLMFLNEPLLKELDHAGTLHPGQNFDFDPAEVIPISVNVAQNGANTVYHDAQGAHVAADANGNVVHFAGIIP